MTRWGLITVTVQPHWLEHFSAGALQYERAFTQGKGMPNNMSNLDRAVRMLAGVVLLIFANGLHDAGNSPASNIWWAWIGVVPLLTAFLGWCPLYSVLGISTRKA